MATLEELANRPITETEVKRTMEVIEGGRRSGHIEENEVEPFIALVQSFKGVPTGKLITFIITLSALLNTEETACLANALEKSIMMKLFIELKEKAEEKEKEEKEEEKPEEDPIGQLKQILSMLR